MAIVRWDAARKIVGSGYLVFIITLLTRFTVLVKLLPEQAWPKFYAFNEPSHIAWAIVSGFGYSTPWSHTPIAPTAQQPPVFPFLIAAIFKIAGAYSLKSLWIATSLSALASSLTAVVILRLGIRDFSELVGIVSSWVWALWPYEAVVSIRLWESALTGLLLAFALWWLPRLGESTSRSSWCLFGLLSAVAAQTNTTTLTIFPCFYVLLWARKKHVNTARVLLSLAMFLLALTPWTIRNYQVFHRLLPMRDNFGLELWIGNHEDVETLHDYPNAFPPIDPTEYNRMGELRFMEAKRDEALSYIREHPAIFLRLSCYRIVRFWQEPRGYWLVAVSVLAWIGVVFFLRHRFIAALPYVCIIVIFPLVYYITHTFPTYRHPIEPVVILLAVYALWSGMEITRRWMRQT